MDTCKTIKVKPWGKDQGDFVEINAEDFDADIHTLVKGEVAPAEPAQAEAQEVGEPAPKPKRRKAVKK